MSVNWTLIEAKMCAFTLESAQFSAHFIFNKCHDDAIAKFSTNSHETDCSVGSLRSVDLDHFQFVDNFFTVYCTIFYVGFLFRLEIAKKFNSSLFSQKSRNDL